MSSIATTPDDAGYWVFTSQGRVIALGSATNHGDLSGTPLNREIIASAVTPTGNGYWMVGSDGGISTFGDAGGIFAFDAPFRGSVPQELGPGQSLNRPVIGAIAHGNGYLMVASDGGILAFSDQPFLGSLGATPPPNPIVGVAART